MADFLTAVREAVKLMKNNNLTDIEIHTGTSDGYPQVTVYSSGLLSFHSKSYLYNVLADDWEVVK